ncbi:MAG: hypothetical protein ABIA78_02425 [archaeon]
MRGAWGNASMVGKVLGIKIPEYDFIQVMSLGQKPLDSFREYKENFIYEMNPEK